MRWNCSAKAEKASQSSYSPRVRLAPSITPYLVKIVIIPKVTQLLQQAPASEQALNIVYAPKFLPLKLVEWLFIALRMRFCILCTVTVRTFVIQIMSLICITSVRAVNLQRKRSDANSTESAPTLAITEAASNMQNQHRLLSEQLQARLLAPRYCYAGRPQKYAASALLSEFDTCS